MKLLIKSALLVSGLLSCFAAQQLYAGERIYLMAGQSNMMGLAHTKNLPTNYKTTPPNVTFFYKGSKRPLARGKHIGPEVSFAHTVARAFPHDQHTIVKFAATGSHIRQWFPGEPYYEGMLRQLGFSVPQEKPEITAIIWMQGEGDALNKQRATEYATNLTFFINRLRTDLDAPNTPFIMGVIDPIGRDFPEVQQVQENQRKVNVTVPNTYLVPAAGVSKIYDNIHFNALGQVEMGKRFARQYIDLVRNNSNSNAPNTQ